MKPKNGEVWLADLGWAAKTRPVVIISRDEKDLMEIKQALVFAFDL